MAAEFLEGGIKEGSELYQKLLLESIASSGNQPTQPPTVDVAPKAGFCLKATCQDGSKVFVNVCTSLSVLKPRDLTEDELKQILATGDATKFRVPMAIGDKHAENDKSGKDCAAYDIVIHPAFFEKINKSEFFMEFFIMLIYEGLESKHEVKLDANYRILKNRKAMGTLQMQNVRTKSTPVIMEMDHEMYAMEKENAAAQRTKQVEVLNTKSTYKTPEYKIIREPPEGKAEFLIMEVQLPSVKSARSLTLDIGEDCVILTSNWLNLKLDIDLPENVNNDESGAQFNQKTKTLTITMPCC